MSITFLCAGLVNLKTSCRYFLHDKFKSLLILYCYKTRELVNGKLPECKIYLQKKKKLKKNVIYARDESLILKKIYNSALYNSSDDKT